MTAQIAALSIVLLVRCLIEFLLGLFIVLVTIFWTNGGPALFSVKDGAEPQSYDRLGLAILGGVLLAVACVRFAQALSSLRAREWARKVGLWLAVLDLATPLTLVLGIWTFVVYRHPDTREHFKHREASAAGDATAS